MGLDLITQRDCEVKEIVPQEELLNHIKHRNRGFTVLNMIIESGKTRDERSKTSTHEYYIRIEVHINLILH
jgi:hypothetical protein